MPKQKGNPKKSVALALAVTVVAVVAFAAAFYFLDGMSLVEDFLGTGDSVQATSTKPPAGSSQDETGTAPPPSGASSGASGVTTMTITENGLILPEGMPEEFALRIWQEQMDSQANLEHLASGEVERIVFTDVTQEGDESVADITAEFRDGTSSQGKIGFRRYSNVWYASWVTGIQTGDTGTLAADTDPGSGKPPKGTLPDPEDVDIELLNTIVREHVKSAAVSEEYATGVVEAVTIEDVVDGPDTLTLKLEMDETHEEGYGDAIMIVKEIGGRTHWFIARFTKTQAQ